MPGENQLELEIVVNGRPTLVRANRRAPLHTVIPHALQQTGNVGQPPEDWELRDAGGQLLPVETKIEDFRFSAGTRLFLNLKAGVGGLA